MIWAFGDSFTWGSCHEDLEVLDVSRTGRVETTFVSLLSKHFGQQHINFGWPGNSNYLILTSLLKRVHKFHKGDIVVVGLTSWGRGIMPLYGKADKLCGLLPSTIEYGHYPDKDPLHFQYMPRVDIAKRYIESLAVYEHDEAITGLLQEELLATYTGLIKSLNKQGVSMYVWPFKWSTMPYYSYKNDEKWKNYRCPCGHWNEGGHKWFSQKLIKFIENNKYGIMELTNKNLYHNLKF